MIVCIRHIQSLESRTACREVGCPKASTPHALLDQSSALALEFRGIIENVQYIRNIFYSRAEVYNRNLEVIVS